MEKKEERSDVAIKLFGEINLQTSLVGEGMLSLNSVNESQ